MVIAVVIGMKGGSWLTSTLLLGEVPNASIHCCDLFDGDMPLLGFGHLLVVSAAAGAGCLHSLCTPRW